MSNEDVILSIEATPGTWVTPAVGFPTNKAVYALGRQKIERRYSGRGRALAANYNGAIMPSGSLEMDFFPDYMGMLLQAAGFSDVTSSQDVGATTAYEHAFNVDTGSLMGSLSAQFKRSALFAHNVLQMTLTKMTLKLVAGEVATVMFDYVAKDMAEAGDTWNYDGASASPAVVGSPTYISATLTPYIFYNVGALTAGGTVAQDGTTKQVTVSGGTTLGKVESLEITIDNGATQFTTLGTDPTPAGMPNEDLEITLKMDMDFSTLVNTYHEYFRNGTEVALDLQLDGAQIESGHNYMAQCVIPSLSFNAAEYPDIEGSASRRKQVVEAVAVNHSSLDLPISFTLRDTQSSY